MGAAKLHIVTYEEGDAEDLRNTPTNQKWTALARGLLQEALIQACRRGTHGGITLFVSTKDGTIQNVTTTIEQSHRPK